MISLGTEGKKKWRKLLDFWLRKPGNRLNRGGILFWVKISLVPDMLNLSYLCDILVQKSSRWPGVWSIVKTNVRTE